MKSKLKLLLLKDVEDLGRLGEIVAVKPGFARNYLLPKKAAVFATKNALKMQEKLQKERAVKSKEEKKEAEALAKIIEPMDLSITVKADVDGKMFGSVSAQDIATLFEVHSIKLTKKNIVLKKPIKEIGVYEIPILLKEGIETKITLKIVGEKVKKSQIEKEIEKEKEEEKTEKKAKSEKKAKKAKEEETK
ncbi:MAG: 50S ribosomal protein L9 [Candidatus Anoxychlamydiales bacterium]|nr:50S ribosomal protein L9 [Candidatus Anoxychlamydiales bacterium]